MDDKKEKTGFWQSWMTIAILLAFTLMVVWFNSQSPSIRPEPDENISIGNGTHVPIGNGTNFTIENGANISTGNEENIPIGNNTNVQMDIDTSFQNWIVLSFKVIDENLECISKAGNKRNFTDMERCGKFLGDNSNISLRHINEYNNVSSSMKTVLDEYEKALKDYNIGGIKLEIGARNGNVSQMGDAIGDIQNGTNHIKVVDKILYQDVINARYANSSKEGNATGENTT